MLKQIKRDFRLGTAIETLIRSRAYFWTFTTKDVVSFSEISMRWRCLRHFLGEHYKPFRYVQNFELHPFGHGWHIHLVSDTFINLKKHLVKIQSFGFGRVHVELVTNAKISGYLKKHAFKPLRRGDKDDSKIRFRRINLSRNLKCPLSRFEVVGGSSGWLRPSNENFHDDYRAQIIAHTYGVPVIPDLDFHNPL